MTVAITYTVTNQCGPAKEWSPNCARSYTILEEYPKCSGAPAVICANPIWNRLIKGEAACCFGTHDDAGDPAFPRYLSVTITGSGPGFCPTACCSMDDTYLCEWNPFPSQFGGQRWICDLLIPGATAEEQLCDEDVTCHALFARGTYRGRIMVSCLQVGSVRALDVRITFWDRVFGGFNSEYDVYFSQGLVLQSNLCFEKPVKIPRHVPLASDCDIGDCWVQAVP